MQALRNESSPTPMQTSLIAQHLSKSYGQRQAVADVSLSLNGGEIVGILGPNGAGKSTTIGIIAGLVTADSGSVTLNGQSFADNANSLKTNIGLVTQDIALFEDLTARTNLQIFGALYQLQNPTLAKRIDEVLTLVGLLDRADEKVAAFSGGMKRRLNIAAALIHDPSVVLLDEPTVGVDPQSRNAIFDNLKALRGMGKAILYSTHYMEEAEKLCDRVIIIDQGRVVANDTVANLIRLLPVSNLIDIEFATLSASQREALAHVGEIGQQDSALMLTASVASITDELPVLLAKIADIGATIANLSTRRAGLEILFLHLTGRALRDESDRGDVTTSGTTRSDA
jgi:ABC-2 type transport system ATP-binding protein